MKERWGDAARKLSELLNDDTFRSLEGKSKHQLWLELCDLITKHPREVEGTKVEVGDDMCLGVGSVGGGEG